MSIQYTPFYLNQRNHPTIPSNLLPRGLPKFSNQTAEEALKRMKIALWDTQSKLSTAQERMKRAMDKKRLTKDYEVGNEVVVFTPSGVV